MLIIDRIVSQVGRRVDEASPMVDARLADGSRINAIIPPLALDGPALSIRRFGKKRYTVDDLLDKETLTPDMVEFMQAIVSARLNLLVCGGTGSGKTTMLNCLSSLYPGRRADRHDRGLGRIAAAAAPRRAGWKRGRPTSKARAK